MLRSLPFVLVASACLAAPVPKLTEAVLYCPTTEGAKKVYETRAGGEVVEVTEVVTKVEKKDGVFRVTTKQGVAGKDGGTDFVEVSERGLFRPPAGDHEAPMTATLLKLPAKPGDSWVFEDTRPGQQDSKLTFTVGKEEVVAVPAGTFKAIGVEVRGVTGGVKHTTTIWYAPHVGVVKMVSAAGGQEHTQVLKSFTPGK